MKKKLKILSNCLLLMTAMIWGVAFVAQSVAMDRVGPWTFVFCRFSIAAILLIPVSCVSDRIYRQTEPNPRKRGESRRLLLYGGMATGGFLGLASAMQQIGLVTTSVGKAGFITALYIILVPILGLVLRQRPGRLIWISAGIAVFGFYFIAMKQGEGFQIEYGDRLVLLSSLLYSCQILTISYFSQRVNPVLLSNLEFLFAAVIGAVGMCVFEVLDLAAIQAALIPILYAGVFSSAVGYTLQIIAQKYTEPTVASLLMSMESVFSALAGWILLGQKLSLRELFGCGLVFLAVILAQLPDSDNRK